MKWIMQKDPDLLTDTTELVMVDVVEVERIHQVLECSVSECVQGKAGFSATDREKNGADSRDIHIRTWRVEHPE